MKYIYGFENYYACRELKIKQCEVLKETQGTYVVKADCKITVRKSTMTNGNWKFFETYDKALLGFKNYISWRIDFANREIENNNEVIKKCNVALERQNKISESEVD